MLHCMIKSYNLKYLRQSRVMGTHLKRFDQHISKQLIMQKTNSCDKIIKLDC